jgi:putative spermidine/putrescine transport system permease protein
VRSRRRTGSTTTLAGTLALLFVAPLLVLAVQAFADSWRAPAIVPQRFGLRGARAVLRDPLIPAAIRNSTLVALLTVAGALMLAWPAARALAADGRKSLRLILIAPLLVPPLAVGEGLAPWFLRLGLADHLVAISLAHLVYVLPYMVLVLAAGFTNELHELEQAATSLGAGPLLRLRTVTAPVIRRQLALACALGFTVSWSQYGTSLAVGGGVPMLPIVLVPFVRVDAQLAAVLSLVFLLPPLALAAAAAVTRHPGDPRRSSLDGRPTPLPAPVALPASDISTHDLLTGRLARPDVDRLSPEQSV